MPCNLRNQFQQEEYTPIYESDTPGSPATGFVECRATGKITFQVATGVIITSGLFNYSLDMARTTSTGLVEEFGVASEVSISRTRAGTTFSVSYAFDKVFDRSATGDTFSLRVFQEGSGPRNRAGGPVDMRVTHTPVAFTCQTIDLR